MGTVMRWGVRAPVIHVVAADTGIRHNANSTYDGTISRLMTTGCETESTWAASRAARQTNTDGASATAQTIVCSTTIDTAVTQMRNAFIAAHHG
jgi:hypothetical protein